MGKSTGMGASVSAGGAWVSAGAASVVEGASVVAPQAASRMLKIKSTEIINQNERFITNFLLIGKCFFGSGLEQLKDLSACLWMGVTQNSARIMAA
jgi:hypothetical protein